MKGLVSELKQIVWPSSKRVTREFVLVIIVMILITGVVFSFDMVISKILDILYS